MKWIRTNQIVKHYLPEEQSIQMISINYDITELKDTEAKLPEAKSKAEESDRLKSAFLTDGAESEPGKGSAFWFSIPME